MMDQNSRPARKIGIADHLWETYEDMAQQMGSDRDALINQALFMFARLNGFIEVARPGRSEVAAVASEGGVAAAPVPARDDSPLPTPASQRPSTDEQILPDAVDMGMAADEEEQPLVDDEPLSEDELLDDEPLDEPAGAALILALDNADPKVISKDRFVIGRGKHCDLVINSGKVSREHAVIVREGEDFFIEDLGSSNGTWFNKQRIKRRKVEDGDEFFICSERVRLSYQ